LEVSIAPPLALYQGETVATRILRSGGVNTSHVMTELKHDGLGFVTETATTTESSYESHAVATHDSRVDDQRYMPWLPELVIRNTEADSGRRTTDVRVLKYDDAGRLGSVTLRPSRSDWLETTYVRNDLGLIERVQESAEGHDARVTQIKWDTWGLAPERVENAEGHVQLLAVHPAFGVPVVTVDPNGVVSRAAYDGFGRLRSTTTLAGTAEVVYGRAEGSDRIAQRRPGEGWTVQVLDEHARPVRVQSEATDDRSSVLEVEYDERGRLSRTTLPRFEGESTHVAMNYFYDELDRLTVAYPGASLYRAGVRHEYSPGRRRSFAADGGERRLGPVVDEYYDSAGLLRFTKTTTTDAGTTSLQYEYGTAGLEVITDQSGTQWATDVDALERPTSTYDPDAGSRSYRFNAFGEVEAELDDDGNELLVIERDRLGRPLRFVHRDEGVTTVEWDPIGGVGRPEWVYDEATGVRVTWAYEEETGRLSSEITTAPDGSEYVTSVKYDEFGRPELVTYGDVVIRYVYDELGNLEQIVNHRTGAELWRALRFDAAGRVTAERWSAARGGDGRRVERRVDFDPRTGEINSITLDRGLSRLEELSFVYDQLGRLETASSLKRARTETFKYDDLHRVRAWIIDGTEVAEYRYDDVGNLESRFGIDLQYDDVETPHRLTAMVAAGGAASAVKYDERGRRYQWGAREVDYNRFDLPTHVRDAGAEVATYAYDGLGRRAWSNDERGETFYAAGGAWEVRRGNDGRRTTTVHLRAPSGTPIELVSNEGDSNLEVLYSLTDVLGSARATIDGRGDIVAYHDFDPFGAPTEADGRPTGEIVGLPSGLDRGFTGHRHDPTGFIDMGGRVYDPMTASFLTPDPVVVDLTNRQALHPYSYVLNSPTNFTDPTGFAPAEYGDGGVWGGIAAGFVSAIAGLLGGKDSGKPGPAGVEQVWLENGDTRRSHDPVQRTPTADVRGVRRAQSSSATARARDAGVVTVPHVELGMTRLSMHDFGAVSYDDIVRANAIAVRDYVQEVNARGRPSIMGIEVPPTDAAGMMADGITQFFGNVATIHDRQASGWSKLWAGVQVGMAAWSGVGTLQAMTAAPAAGQVVLDANALVGMFERGERVVVEAAIRGRQPLIPITAAKEYMRGAPGARTLTDRLARAQRLRFWMQETGAVIAPAASESSVIATQMSVGRLGRALGIGDARVLVTAEQAVAALLTRDAGLRRAAQAIGFVVEVY
jgi:RHS repeat-associated protein